MSRHHIDFVALDLSLQHDRRGAVDDPLSELLDMARASFLLMFDIELLGDL